MQDAVQASERTLQRGVQDAKFSPPCTLATGSSAAVLPSPSPDALGETCRLPTATTATVAEPALSFAGSFGLVGALLLLAALVCVVWTSLLVALMLAPNAAANHLMDTGDLDDGQFWLIVDPEPEIKYLAVSGLLAVDLFYVRVVVRMATRRQAPLRARYTRAVTPEDEQEARSSWSKATMTAHWKRVGGVFEELTSVTGRDRKLWNAVLKVVDLAIQSFQLAEALASGFPPPLVRGYSLFLSSNALSCAIAIVSSNHSAMAEILVDAGFDMLGTIAYPIVVLLYSYYHFDLDRRTIRINTATIPPGHFERNARMTADPSEIALFLAGFDSLRILTYTDLLLRISMNLSVCNRLRCVVNEMLSAHQRQVQVHPVQAGDTVTPTSSQAQRPVPRSIASLFIAFAALGIAYSERAVAASRSACGAYPQCAVYAHRWSSNSMCPCLALIDVERSPKTYREWMNPADVTDVVRQLSVSGDLRALQVINRGLPHWPDELRGCRQLEFVSLIYTGIEEIPVWAKEFKRLVFLHLEGKELFPNLQTIEDDLFTDMPRLTFLVLATHDDLRKLPPLDGVPRLRSLSIAHMISLPRVPSFDMLPELQRLQLSYLSSLAFVPDMSRLTKLIHFSTTRAAYYCCNGFRGTCDLTDRSCRGNPDIGTAPARCLAPSEPRITPGTRAVFATFQASICQTSGFEEPSASDMLTRESIDMCGGVRYRQCKAPSGSGQVGICYNNRMQVLSCVVNPSIIRLRRAQIAAGAGPACDPAVEAWLGCDG